MTSIRHAAAHLVLPALVFAEPTRTLRRLSGADAGSFLAKTVWGLAAGFSDDKPVAPEGLGAWSEPVGNARGVVVRFPSPRRAGEAHAAVLVPTRRWLPLLAGTPRYFTLERSREGTVLGEWTDQWVHLSYGPGPRASDKDGFLRAIAEVLAGQREVVDSTPRHVAEHVVLRITRAAAA